MNKIKVLFFIHDLGNGGAEKVLVNLANNLDQSQFDVYLTVIFGGGVNEQFLDSHVHYKALFPRMIPGNSVLMKLFSPQKLHQLFVKDHYDIEAAYLEGPSTRVISGCTDKETRLICWIHSNPSSLVEISSSFRSENEVIKAYSLFDKIVVVSKQIKDSFTSFIPAY